MNNVKISEFYNRRAFLKLVPIAGTALFLAFWYILTGKNRKLLSKPVEWRIDTRKLGDGVYFYDNFIVSVNEGKTSIFSNKCTHAGCLINREISGELVCPCHGSKFNAKTGAVLRGPAILPLHRLTYKVDSKTGEIVVIS